MKTLKDANIQNKTVLLRADLDLSEGSDLRLAATVPTIKFLLENNCKVVIVGHKGRPNGKIDDEFSLFPVFEKLKLYFPKKDADDFKFVSSILSKEAKEIIGQAKFGDIIMLENLRFYPGEEENDLAFTEYLASLANVYVNDAFGVCHRQHASITGIVKFIPGYAGLRLQEEVEKLKQAMEKPAYPAVAIIGGAKLETKLPVISKMAEIYDFVLVGGKMAINKDVILRNKETKDSDELSRHPEEAERRRIPLINNSKIILSTDYIGEEKLDIGPETIKNFTEIILKAKTVIWNGPMGKIEDERFIHGTKMIASAIIESRAFSIVGGGDTIAALEKINLLDKFSWISTGGGAMLEFLAGERLPGIEVLK
ncbi:MAG: phosphoglycerate kinase [bacterium]